MTIGELLRQYRLEQGKTQKEWAGAIVSPSCYSKVEKNIHRITADDLVNLLQANNVNIISFFSKLNWSDKVRYDQFTEISQAVNEAYYLKDQEKLAKIRKKIEKADIPDKEVQLLIIAEVVASMTDNLEVLGEAKIQKLKELVFSSDNFDEKRLRLYTNLIRYFDFASNLSISQRVINKFSHSQTTSDQEAVMGICANMLEECIIHDDYDSTQFYIEAANKFTMRPLLFFIKNMLVILQNMIAYHKDKDPAHLSNAQRAIDNYAMLGVPAYGQEAERFFTKYKDQ